MRKKKGKSHKGSGMLFLPEMKEAVKRIKGKEKELDEILNEGDKRVIAKDLLKKPS